MKGTEMIIEDGCTYKCKNGYIVRLKRNSLPYYKFSCVEAFLDGIRVDCSEVFTEEGKAYHSDCGYNIVSKL